MARPVGKPSGLLRDRRWVCIGEGVLGAIPLSTEEGTKASPAPCDERARSETEGRVSRT